jgi:hypothetical protein
MGDPENWGDCLALHGAGATAHGGVVVPLVALLTRVAGLFIAALDGACGCGCCSGSRL